MAGFVLVCHDQPDGLALRMKTREANHSLDAPDNCSTT